MAPNIGKTEHKNVNENKIVPLTDSSIPRTAVKYLGITTKIIETFRIRIPYLFDDINFSR